MQSLTTLGLIALTYASRIEIHQTYIGIIANEFTQGGCRDIIMLFARGSTEAGNMGTICGPPTANGLRKSLGANAVAVEGVEYEALMSTNYLPGGADLNGISEMKRLIGQVASQCPKSKLVVGGYSQGAAVTHRAIENLPADQKAKIVSTLR